MGNENNFANLTQIHYDSITRIELSGTVIDSTIPSDISKLKNLTHLNLSNCSIKGTIPSSIGTLTNLINLNDYVQKPC